MKFKPEYIILLVVGMAVIAGAFILHGEDPQKKVQSENLIDNGIEVLATPGYEVQPYIEIVNPSGFVNTEPLQIADLIGEKVVLVKFTTYSCINCQRTYPFVNDWYEKYKDQGLEIVAIHTPEFAFEKNIDNVKTNLDAFGITYPTVLDNDYSTWRAYKNRFWPRAYLIDIHGNIVYDHIGEGDYEITEAKIQELLQQRADVLQAEVDLGDVSIIEEEVRRNPQTPELYFGAWRNDLLGNGTPRLIESKKFTLPNESLMKRDVWYLGGDWDVQQEFARGVTGSILVLPFQAGEIFTVSEALGNGAKVEVSVDGEVLHIVDVNDPILYTLYDGEYRQGLLQLKVLEGEFDLYTFTFGQ